MQSHLRNTLAGLTLFLSSACSSLPPIDEIKKIVRHHQAPLESLALRSQDADQERGAGIVLLEDGTTEYVELENEITRDREKFYALFRGDHTHYQTLLDHIDLAVKIRSLCDPELTPIYNGQSTDIRGKLFAIARGAADENFALTTWTLYDSLVMHHIFSPTDTDWEKLKARGKLILHIHTHQGKKHILPSAVDLANSEDRDGLVIAIDSAGAIKHYFSRDGETQELYMTPARTIVARAD